MKNQHAARAIAVAGVVVTAIFLLLPLQQIGEQMPFLEPAIWLSFLPAAASATIFATLSYVCKKAPSYLKTVGIIYSATIVIPLLTFVIWTWVQSANCTPGTFGCDLGFGLFAAFLLTAMVATPLLVVETVVIFWRVKSGKAIENSRQKGGR